MLGNNTRYYRKLADSFRGANRGTEKAPTSGWEGRSDTSAYKRYLVFAVGGILESQQFNAWALAENIAFKRLQGCYKGEKEPSFIVEDTNENRLRLAYWVKGQESILCLGPAYRKRSDGQYQLFGNREAILDFLEPDGYGVRERKQLAGLWSAVSKATALRQDSWTFDPSEDQYYAVV